MSCEDVECQCLQKRVRCGAKREKYPAHLWCHGETIIEICRVNAEAIEGGAEEERVTHGE